MQGISREAVKAVEVADEVYTKFQAGVFEEAEEKLQPMYDFMAKDIVRQRKRLGGNMAIAEGVFSQSQRNFLRKAIGPDLVFIVLNLTKDCQTKRVNNRHGDSLGEEFIKLLINYAEQYEPAAMNEKNAYNISVTEGMSPKDVMEKVIEIVEKLQ